MKIRKGLIGAGALVAGLLSGPAWAEQSIKARDLIQQIFGVDAETLASAWARPISQTRSVVDLGNWGR